MTIGSLFEKLNTPVITNESPASPNMPVPVNADENETKQIPPKTQANENVAAAAADSSPDIYICLFFVWSAAALGLFVRKITIYQGFTQYIKAGNTEVSDIKILNLLSDCEEKLNIKTRAELYRNTLISSPMMTGFLRPGIALPAGELGYKALSYIFMHELIHYKQRDMFYKWLIQIVVCIHWFNPFVYLLEKEVNNACELSCDEAVLSMLDDSARHAYGDTLVSFLKPGNPHKSSFTSVTLAEGAGQLKERLGAIMNFSKKTKTVRFLTGLLTLCIIFGAAFASVYPAAAASDPNSMDTKEAYAAYGIVKNGKSIYYQGKLIYVFLDQRSDYSFYVGINPEGTASIKVIRDSEGKITGIAYMAEEDVTKLTGGRVEIPAISPQDLDDGNWDDKDWDDDADWDWDDEGWDEEQADKALEEAYAAHGIARKGKSYYYQGELVYIIKDQRPDSSFYMLDGNSDGTVSIKVIRNTSGEITGVSYMTDGEVAELLPRILGTSEAIPLINTKEWDSSALLSVESFYATDNIYIMPSPTDKIILKEYLTDDNPDYYAHTEIKKNVLTIRSGGRPGTNYKSYIELYVPDDVLNKVETVSGAITADDYTGVLALSTTSGMVNIFDSDIAGNINTVSGSIGLFPSTMLGDLYANSHSGKITAIFPASVSYNIKAETATGKIKGSYFNTQPGNKKEFSGSTGSDPKLTIMLKTFSANIEIN